MKFGLLVLGAGSDLSTEIVDVDCSLDKQLVCEEELGSDSFVLKDKTGIVRISLGESLAFGLFVADTGFEDSSFAYYWPIH